MAISELEREELPETIYSPEPQLRHPGKLLRSMLHDLKASKELAWRLFVRNINARYRQTSLGYLWAFLPPIFTTFIFVFLNSQKVLNVKSTTVPYPVYVMVGTLLWQVFVDALNSPLKLVTSSRAMLIKINFPREALILAGIGEVLFNFSIRFILFIIVFIWFKVPVSTTIFLAPVGVMSLLMFGLMIGLLLTPLGILYQDVGQGLMMATTLWFFLTPVVYPPPSQWPAALLAGVNPVSPLLLTTREWITSGSTDQTNQFLLLTCMTWILIVLGWLLYRLAMPHLIARIGS